jgi:hypothetical protein
MLNFVLQNDPAKLAIWLEVFKRSVLRARPVRPFVVLTESLPIADASKTEIFFETVDEFSKIERKSSTFDRPNMGVAKQVLSFAVVVTTNDDGHSVDLFSQQATNFSLNRKIILPQTQKASEVRDYIRDYTVSRWNQPLETFVFVSDENSGIFSTFLVAVAQSVVVEPLGGVASVDDQVCQASVGNHVRPSFEHLLRSSFGLVSRMRPVAECELEIGLEVEVFLPNVQYVKEQASDIVHDGAKLLLDRVSSPVDILWFFQVKALCRLKASSYSDQRKGKGFFKFR